MVVKNAKRILAAASFALLLPGAAGAAGFGAEAEPSFWAKLASPMELAGRILDGWDGLSSLWTAGMTIDPNGDGNGAGVCPDCGATIDPNG
jgi:hypothetical protein